MDNFEERKKKVDESWKAEVKKEQENTEKTIEAYPQEITFGLFLSSLMIEGLIALGDLENPITKKKEANLNQARYIIDVIAMLEEKTKNTVIAEEKNAFEQMLYELRMRYVSKTNAPKE